MSISSDKFRTKKRDQSPYLFHFTSGNEYEAAEILKTILQEKKLKSKMYDRSWKGLSLESIRDQNFVDDYQVSGSTITQIIGADMFEEVSEQMSRKTKELNEAIAKSWEDMLGNLK